MVTYAQLHMADPERWMLAAGMFRIASVAIADRSAQINAVMIELHDVWSGLAGTAALARLASTRSALAMAHPTLVGIDQALSEFAETINLAQNALADASTPALGSIVRVDPEGVAYLMPGMAPPDAGDRTDLERTTQAIVSALEVAAEADRDTARRLAAAIAEFADVEPLVPVAVPAYGSEPVTVAAWWAGLSPSERQFMTAVRPSDVSRDGVPVDARDQACRILLRDQYDELVQRRDLLLAGPRSGSVRAELATVNDTLTGLDRLVQRLDDPYHTRAYLLELDAEANRAIVSIGDPDRTDNVLTLVPGLGSGLAGIATSLVALDHIAAAGSQYAGPWDDLSTVGWLDYTAPANLREAISDRNAARATDRLARFASGIRVTQQLPVAGRRSTHDSMLGYSYGSTVVGFAARDRQLSADDVIFVASPGVGVDHASGLNIDPEHVWSTVAKTDAIHAAIDPIARLVNFVRHGPPGALWFGADPARPRFGGRIFASDPGDWRHPIVTHQSYFATGSTSLDNIAKIAMGDGWEVG